MSYEFERFEAVGGSYEPKLSIRSNGAIGFSQGALHRFGLLDGDWFVSLYYDRKNGVVGIEPVREEGPGFLRLIKRAIKGKDGRDSVNAFVSAKSFLDYFSIDYRQTRSFRAHFDEPSHKIVFNVSQPDHLRKGPSPQSRADDNTTTSKGDQPS
jgi:hypothetical protein